LLPDSANKSMITQVLRFAMVGLGNTCLGLTVIYGLMFFLYADPLIANAVGYLVGFCFSFMLNKSWTFGEIKSRPGTFWRFATSTIIAYAANLSVVAIGTKILMVDPYLMQAVGIILYTSITFFGSKLYVFTGEVGRHQAK